MGRLLEELKRRKVFRVAALYAVVAWVLIQVTDVVLPTFGAPEWVNQTVIFLFVLGFIPTLIAAWAYEITPDGIQADPGKSVLAAPSSASGSDRYLIYATFALVLVVAGIQLSDRFLSNSREINLDSAVSKASDASLSPDNKVTRSLIPLGDLHRANGSGPRLLMALSRDGTRLAYVSFSPEITDRRRTTQRIETTLNLRTTSQFESKVLSVQENFTELAFSPDGNWLAYIDENQLMKVALDGGAPQALARVDSPQAEGLSWSEDDVLFMVENRLISRVSANGGPIQSLGIAPLHGEQEWQAWPHVLPGDEALLFTRSESNSAVDSTSSIAVFDLNSGVAQTLIQDAYNASYSSTGHILFIRSGSLWSVPFDLEEKEITGSAMRLEESVEGVHSMGQANYALSSFGDLVYLPGENVDLDVLSFKSVLAWVDRSGNESVLNTVPQRYLGPSLSPDGKTVAIGVGSQGSDIWSYDLEREALSRVTFSRDALFPIWTPDGKSLVYKASDGIKQISANGIGEERTLLGKEALIFNWFPSSFSPDGSKLIFQQDQALDSVSDDIYSVDLNSGQATVPLIASEYFEATPRISPDGRWIAYVSDETGIFQVYVRPYPAVESGKWMVSVNGGSTPEWRADSGELFYRRRLPDDLDRFDTFVVPIAGSEEFNAGTPELLFTSDHFVSVGSYTVSADGQRLLMLKPAADADRLTTYPTNLVLVHNFDEELK